MKKKYKKCKYCLRTILEEWKTEKGCRWCDTEWHNKKRRCKECST